MFTAYYVSGREEEVIGVIDGMPVRIPFENKPFYYKTGYLLIIAVVDPDVAADLFPQSFNLPEKPDAPLDKLFPQRSFKIPEGNVINVVKLRDEFRCLTNDIQALEWFGRLQSACNEASDYAKGDYAKYCQFVADRMGVPCVSLDKTLAPRKLAAGAMTPEQVQEVVGF